MGAYSARRAKLRGGQAADASALAVPAATQPPRKWRAGSSLSVRPMTLSPPPSRIMPPGIICFETLSITLVRDARAIPDNTFRQRITSKFPSPSARSSRLCWRKLTRERKASDASHWPVSRRVKCLTSRWIDHPFSLSQCRPYQFFQMVTAGGIHQQGFAHWRPVRASGRMQCKFANSFCQWSAAGLARCDDVKALSPQALCQSVLKRGLACTFTAFERNESEGRDLSHHCRRSSG